MAGRKLPIVVVVFLGLGGLLSTAGADSRDSLVTARSKSLTDEDGRLLLAPGAGRLATGPAARRVESIDSELSRAASAAIPTADSGTDWNNFGGSPGRTGLTTVKGPDAAEPLWDNTDDFSIISWHPVTHDGRVFAIRESGFPQQNGPANDKLVAYDLATGEELWSEIVSWAGDPDEEWIAYVGGAHGGRVYCARGGSGRTTPVHAYAVETGELLWSSVYETVAGPQDGMVFAPNGDVIVCDFGNAVRIDATDGSTVWATPRSCPVSGNCGCTASDTAAYIDEAAPGPSNVITKIDMATGDVLYSTPSMAGFTTQNAPFLSADGDVVYFARSQNNQAVDFLFAFEDTGTEFVELWSRPVRWTTSHEHGIGPDGSIYTFLPGDEFVRLDPNTGDVMDSAGVLSPIGPGNLSPRTAVGSDGNVYVSNGWANTPDTDGRIWGFTADLSQTLFQLVLDRQNSGGPSLGQGGTLVVADRVGVYAYRTSFDPPPVPDGNLVPGNAMIARKHSDGVDIVVRWDVLTCPADDYNLLLGDLSAVSSVNVTSAVCGLGTSGAATFTPPAGNVFWVIASENADGVEGSHGVDSNGDPRPSNAIGLCGIVDQSFDGTCP